LEADSDMNRWKTVRIITGAIGVAMVATALVSALPEAPGRIEFLLVILGVTVIAAAILGSRAGAAYRSIAIIGLNTVMLFTVLEIGASLLLGVITRGRSKPDAEPRPAEVSLELSPFYADQEWASRYWAEIAEQSATGWYHPYEFWRRAPFRGQLTNISLDGLRLTPGAKCQSGALVVYTFGGSGMWGVGVPDWGTIAAYLQAHWSRTESRPVCVVNFGQPGHTSTQGLIALERELQRCKIPDLVVFYDSVNDLNYGRISGIPGAHRHLLEIALTLETGVPAWPSWVRSLSVLQLAREFMPKAAPRPHRYQPRWNIAPDLADGIAEVYLNNVRMVEALAVDYGFANAFFWQPHIMMGKKPLTEAEKRILEATEAGDGPIGRDGERAGHKLYRQVYASVARAAQSDDHLHDISDVLDSVPSLVYLDSHHLTPDGNRRVAERMLQLIGDRIAIPGGSRPARACHATPADR